MKRKALLLLACLLAAVWPAACGPSQPELGAGATETGAGLLAAQPAGAVTSTTTPIPPGGTPTVAPASPPTTTPSPTARPSPSPAPSTVPSPSATARPIATRSPSPPPPPPVPAVLSGPMVVDSEAGRLYVPGQVGDALQILALSAAGGQLLATYPASGPFAVDGVNGWLCVDQGPEGLAVLSVETGAVQATIPLPPPTMAVGEPPPPQADPAAGQVLAFRDNVLYVVDPAQERVVHSIPTSVKLYNSGVLPIAGAIYDSSQRLLYLMYQYSPAFRYNFTALVSFDLASETEIARQQFSQTGPSDLEAVVAGGSLYGQAAHWFAGPGGSASFWTWREGKPYFASQAWTQDVALGLQFDAKRLRLYATTGSSLLLFDAPTMALRMGVPRPAEGRLVGYDPRTDQLYYLTASGELRMHSAAAIQPPTPEPLAAASPPALPVRALALSPTWTQGRTLFGIWQAGTELEDHMALGLTGGSFYLGRVDQGAVTWHRSLGGLRNDGHRFSALGVSSDYVNDRTILAGIVGLGVFRSTDGGQLWIPSSAGLKTMQIDELLLSPDFARDGTAFAVSAFSELHRSLDGGQTWHALSLKPYRVAMSAEFDQDQVLMASGGDSPGEELHLSRDGGDSWDRLGLQPGESSLTMLSLAPLFARWQTAFAYEENGLLYRSDDGGQSWDLVLDTGAAPSRAQLVYAPGIEVNRPLFLLAAPRYNPTYNTATGYVPAEPPTEGGTLYRSSDGGQSWQEVALPPELSPTALAISPDFAHDHLLYVGTIDGQVVALDTGALAGQP